MLTLHIFPLRRRHPIDSRVPDRNIQSVYSLRARERESRVPARGISILPVISQSSSPPSPPPPYIREFRFYIVSNSLNDRVLRARVREDKADSRILTNLQIYIQIYKEEKCVFFSIHNNRVKRYALVVLCIK